MVKITKRRRICIGLMTPAFIVICSTLLSGSSGVATKSRDAVTANKTVGGSSQYIPVPGKWLQVTGPVGQIRELFVTGDRLMVATAGYGGFISDDNGANWRPAYNSTLTRYINSFAVMDAKIFAGTSEALVVSTDGGTSWAGINYDPRSPTPVWSLAVIGDQLFAARNGFLYVSSDQGVNWTRLNNPPGYSKRLATDGVNLFVVTTESGLTTESGVFVSTDKGQSWSEVGGAQASPKADRFVLNGEDIFVTVRNGGVFHWSARRQRWTAVNNGLPPNSFPQALAVKGGKVFTAIGDVLFVSTNNGASWDAITSGLPKGRIWALAANSTRLFAGTTVGVFSSTDDGASWQPTANGPADGVVLALAAAGSRLFAGTANYGVYTSTDGGVKWVESNRGLTAMRVNSFATIGSNLFAGTDGGVFASNDAGENWAAVNNGLAARNVYSLAVSGAKLAAGTDGGVFILENNGASWTRASNGLPSEPVNALAFKGSYLFAGLNQVYVSTDNGANWRYASSGIPQQYGLDRIGPILSLAVAGERIAAGTGAGGAYVSTDNGGSWASFTCGMGWFTPQWPHLASVFSITSRGTIRGTSRDDDLFAGTNVGALASPASACNWARYNDGFIVDGYTTTVAANVLALLISGESFYAGTAGGIFINTVPATVLPLVTASAASYRAQPFASESIAAAFGDDLAAATEAANSLPLPTTLAGTTVKVKDSAGVERLAPLFFVSPRQVNYLVPSETAVGDATAILTNSQGKVFEAYLNVRNVAPGLFSANADGKGVAAGVAFRVKADGASGYEPIARYDETQKKFVAVPIDLGPQTDQLFVILFGTGMRFRRSLSDVTAQFGSAANPAQALYVGPQDNFAGLDQVNLRVPRTLVGRGEVEIILRMDGTGETEANRVTVNIR